MDGSEYESLMIMIYKVNSGELDGVDAEIYKQMEHARMLYDLEVQNVKQKTPRLRTESLDSLAYKYRVQCRKVWRYLTEAINNALKKNRHQLSNDKIKELQNIIHEPVNITQEHIDKIISTAHKILSAHQTN